MNDKEIQLLNELAGKLGTTSEYLWGILVKQAPIDGIMAIIVFTSVVILTTIWTKVVYKKTVVTSEWRSEGMVLFSWISMWIMLVTTFLLFINIPNAIVGIINPEYWALKFIFSNLRG